MSDTFTLDEMMVPSTDYQDTFTLDEMMDINKPTDFNEPDKLGYFASIAEGFVRGNRSSTLDTMQYESLLKGEQDYFQRVKPEKVKFYEDVQRKRLDDSNWFKKATISVAEMLPAMGKGMASGAGTGAVAAGGALAAGALLPIPEELVTVPAAFSAGSLVGSAQYWYRQGSGSLYGDLKDEGISDDIARPTAHIAGALYSAIEFAQVTKFIPGGKEVTKKFIASTVQKSIKNVIQRYGTNWAENVFEEGLQEIVMETAHEVSREVSGKSNTAIGDKAYNVMTKGWEAMKESALPMLLLLAPAMGKSVVDVTAEGKKTEQAVSQPQEVTDAEGHGTEVTPTGGEEGVVGEAEAGVRVRDDAEGGMEAGEGEVATAESVPTVEFETEPVKYIGKETTKESFKEQLESKLQDVEAGEPYANFVKKQIDSLASELSIAKKEKLGDEITSFLTEEIEELNQDYQSIKEQKVTMGEKNVLRQRISDVTRGMREGGKLSRDEVKDVQTQVINILKDSDLDTKDKGGFLSTIKNIQTQAQLEKAMPKIEERIARIEAKIQKRKARKEKIKQLNQFIKDMKFQRVEGVRKTLELPKVKHMTMEQLDEYQNILSQYQEGDVFLTERQLETVENTDLTGIRTLREAKEKFSKEIGVDVSQIQNIKVDEVDRMLYDTALARKNKLYGYMVQELHKHLLEAEGSFLQFEDTLNDLVVKARKSVKRSLIDRLIPTDELVFKYLSSENKGEIAKEMTQEEIELATFLSDRYAEALDYLIKVGALKTGIENYVTNIRRGSLEAIKDDGFVAAFKEMFAGYELDQETFNIIDQKGKVLSLEKFFEFAMKRKGGINPSKNVGKAASVYFRVLEKKKAIDAYVPKMMIYIDALSSRELTEQGMKVDESLKNFVKEWINTKKGIPTKLIVQPGGKIDIGLKATNAFVSILDLGFNIPVGIATNIGESVANFAMLGGKKYALGEIRKQTAQGRAITEKYKNFVGKTLWEDITEPSKNIGDKFSETLFGMFRISARNANETFLLGSMTEEEFQSGAISTERLADLQIESGRLRVVPRFRSILGSTTEGAILTKYKTWAVPIFTTAVNDISTVIGDIKNKKSLNSKEAREILNMIEVTMFALWIGSLYDDKETDESFVGQLLSKAKREALTILGALDSKMMLSVPRLVKFLSDVGVILHEIAIMEKYKSKAKKYRGKYKGIEKAKTLLTPRAIKQFDSNKK